MQDEIKQTLDELIGHAKTFESALRESKAAHVETITKYQRLKQEYDRLKREYELLKRQQEHDLEVTQN